MPLCATTQRSGPFTASDLQAGALATHHKDCGYGACGTLDRPRLSQRRDSSRPSSHRLFPSNPYFCRAGLCFLLPSLVAKSHGMGRRSTTVRGSTVLVRSRLCARGPELRGERAGHLCFLDALLRWRWPCVCGCPESGVQLGAIQSGIRNSTLLSLVALTPWSYRRIAFFFSCLPGRPSS